MYSNTYNVRAQYNYNLQDSLSNLSQARIPRFVCLYLHIHRKLAVLRA